MELKTHALRTPTGRPLWVEDSGATDGFPVLVHPGSPGSRRLFGPAAEHAASAHGLRLISYDRPGIGGTPSRPGRAVADCVADVRVIAAELGLTRFAVWGFSGGGPYALACAALLPELVVAACLFASPAPYDAEGLVFADGWPGAYRSEMKRFFDHPELARKRFRTDAEEQLEALSAPEGWMELWGALAESGPAYSREMAEYLAAAQRDCLGRGDQGWWEDWAGLLTPWRFDPTAIRVPVRLWHGARDTSIPQAHGRWLAAHVPGAEADFTADDDHATVEVNHRCRAFDWLNEQL